MVDNKPIAVITGASSGIGEQISLKLASHNFKTVLISRTKDKLIKIKKNIEDSGNECQIIVADISGTSFIDDLKKQLESPQQVQVLINNAANNPHVTDMQSGKSGHHWSQFEVFPLNIWEKDIAVCLTGAFLCLLLSDPSRRPSNIHVTLKNYLI